MPTSSGFRTTVAANRERRGAAEKRSFYAELITALAGVEDPRIRLAFATVPREQFVGPGPWKITAPPGRYVATPSADPGYIYQDVLVALDVDRGINNGQPSLHARCLDAAQLRSGDRVLHIGCGTGYYSALLAQLATERGSVSAWDVDARLAAAALRNLADWDNVTVECRSGAVAPIPACDVIYVSAGCVRPSKAWLDALSAGGRLVFPLTAGRNGVILKVVRGEAANVGNVGHTAQFVCPCGFIPAEGIQDADEAARLADAFGSRDPRRIRSLRFGDADPAREDCWYRGNGWWLSTEP